METSKKEQVWLYPGVRWLVSVKLAPIFSFSNYCMCFLWLPFVIIRTEFNIASRLVSIHCLLIYVVAEARSFAQSFACIDIWQLSIRSRFVNRLRALVVKTADVALYTVTTLRARTLIAASYLHTGINEHHTTNMGLSISECHQLAMVCRGECIALASPTVHSTRWNQALAQNRDFCLPHLRHSTPPL